MTPEILHWLAVMAKTHLSAPGRVLEVGAQNVNGSPRSVLQPLALSYLGTDMQEGAGVDKVIPNSRLLWNELGFFDTIVCCECLEHDRTFWFTVENMHYLLKSGGLLVITTPTFNFPVHRYPRDYWRFGEDAYREVFFDGMDILDLRLLDSPGLPSSTIVGIARKP